MPSQVAADPIGEFRGVVGGQGVQVPDDVVGRGCTQGVAVDEMLAEDSRGRRGERLAVDPGKLDQGDDGDQYVPFLAHGGCPSVQIFNRLAYLGGKADVRS